WDRPRAPPRSLCDRATPPHADRRPPQLPAGGPAAAYRGRGLPGQLRDQPLLGALHLGGAVGGGPPATGAAADLPKGSSVRTPAGASEPAAPVQESRAAGGPAPGRHH